MVQQQRSMKESNDLWPESENFVKEFLEDGPEYLASATACGKEYKCRMTGNHPFWQRTDSPDFDSNGKDVERCRLDSLAAASKAMHTCKPLPGAPDLCKSKTIPVLTNEKDGDHFISFTSMESRVRGMPMFLDATLQCVDEPVSKSTHSRTSSMQMGAITRHEFQRHRHKPIDPPPNVKPSSNLNHSSGANLFSVSPTIDATKPAAATSVTVPNDMSDPSPKETIEPIAEVTSDWKRCAWFSGDVQTSCSTNADCPLEGLKLFDAWFDTVETNTFTGTKMKAVDFIKKVNSSLSRSKIISDESLPQTQMSLMEMRGSLLHLFETDVAFKGSIRKVIESEPKFRNVRSTANQNACVNQRCNASDDTPRPTTTLYNGKYEGSFQRDAIKGTISFADDNGLLAVEAVKCVAGVTNSLCEEEDESQVTDLRADRGKSKISLFPGKTPTAPTYRLHFGQDVYAITNRVQVHTNSTEDAPAVCAQILCERNNNTCPAPYCLRQGNTCVPDANASLPTLLPPF